MKIVIAILLLCMCLGAQAQVRRRDPLNSHEVEQMRDAAQDPKKRIDLLLSFARERMLAVERLRSSTKPGVDDGNRIADLLGDLALLIDELDDNLAMYNGHSEDLRRPLRHVLATEDEFQQKLQAIANNASPLQKHRFAAALEDVSDSLKSSSESAKSMLADQIEKKGEEKNKEKRDREDAKQQQAFPSSDAERQRPPDTGIDGSGRPQAPR